MQHPTFFALKNNGKFAHHLRTLKIMASLEKLCTWARPFLCLASTGSVLEKLVFDLVFFFQSLVLIVVSSTQPLVSISQKNLNMKREKRK